MRAINSNEVTLIFNLAGHCISVNWDIVTKFTMYYWLSMISRLRAFMKSRVDSYVNVVFAVSVALFQGISQSLP